MKQKYTFTECYRILTLNPECTWSELRKTYKQQIQKWHPDKFAGQIQEKEAANDKIQRITSAYQQLAIYYRHHGVLPAPENASTTLLSQYPKPTDNPASPFQAREPQPNKTNTRQSKKRAPLISVLLVSTVTGFLIFNFDNSDDKKNNIIPTQPSYTQPPSQATTSASEKILKNNESSAVQIVPVDDDFVTYGSSIGEVITILGAPTRDEGETWYYSDSEIYFINGQVVGWKQMPNSKLKIGIMLDQSP